MRGGRNEERPNARRAIPGAAQQHLPAGVEFLHPEEAVFEAMLGGWARQMKSRSLASTTIEDRVLRVRSFARYTNEYPWSWQPDDLEDWSSFLRSKKKPVVHSTLRGYQSDIRMFLDYLTDLRYGWVEECERRFGDFPAQICHEWNMASHRDGYEGQPEVRPFSRRELQDFFDFCDEKVAASKELGRKGWLAAFRDATIFKVIYGWGLRRAEVAKLDLQDFGPLAIAPEFGKYGTLVVRWGKSMAGSPPRRRNVLTVWGWAQEVVEEYVEEIRPLYNYAGKYAHADSARTKKQEIEKAMWPTERGSRVSPDYLTKRFALYREELGLPEELHPHCLRHSYITHLIEDGWEPLFVQQQAGHRWGSTTALYTGVSNDFKNQALRKALNEIYGEAEGDTSNRPQGGHEHDADEDTDSQRNAR